jgi:Flp pilus assembly protein TadB
VAVAVASVRALERLGEQSAVMPLYDMVQNEIADPAVRRASAEALVKFGLLRRERTGPSPMFLWLAGLTGVVVAVGAASILGPWAILLFLAGAGALALYAMRQLGRRGAEDASVGPHGERIEVPGAGRPGAAAGANGGGGGNGGGA